MRPAYIAQLSNSKVAAMVRPVVYKPVKAFKLSESEIAKYKKISEQVKTGAGDASKSVKSIADSLTTTPGYETSAWDPLKDDAVTSKDGIALDSSTLTAGELDADTSEVFFEEPRVVAEDEEEEDDERSLWGDGDKDPAAGED